MLSKLPRRRWSRGHPLLIGVILLAVCPWPAVSEEIAGDPTLAVISEEAAGSPTSAAVSDEATGGSASAAVLMGTAGGARAQRAAWNPPLGQSAQSLPLANSDLDHLDYLLYLPSTYYKTPLKKWPLIVFLHGSDEIGADIALVKGNGIPAIIEKKKDFQFMVVSPQCPPDQRWSPPIVKRLIDSIVGKLRVDSARVYLTGYSMGGFGTWDTAAAYPQLFAAIAPVCGGGDVQRVAAMTEVPVWAFHGARDANVPLEESVRMVAALNRVGGSAKLTVYPDLAHDSWTATYANPALYRWFLRHTKGPMSSVLAGVRKVWRKLMDAAQILSGTVLVPF